MSSKIHPIERKGLRRIILLLFVTLLFSESAASDSTPRNETFQGWTCDDILAPHLCPLSVHSETITVRGINVRYWRYSLKNGTRIPEKLPVVVLHGGPSFPHNYLLPLKKLACDGRHVVFYDQAGCSESYLPLNGSQSVKKDYPWLLDPEYYALEELPALLKHLAVDRYHLLGHSWGTMLAQLFALNAPLSIREGLASMVLSGCISDSELFIQQQWDPTVGSLGTLPPFVQERIKLLEEQKAYHSLEYKALDDILTTYFTCRTAPLPDCFQKSAAHVNREIYVGMQGASEFANSGVLANFNTTGRLHELHHLPILLSSGAYDTVRPKVVEVMHQNLALSERFFFRRSGHVSAIDEPVLMNQVVSDFLNRVEKSFHLQQGFVPLNTFSTTIVKQDEPPETQSQNIWTSVLCATMAFLLGALVMHLWDNRLAASLLSGYDRIEDSDPAVMSGSGCS